MKKRLVLFFILLLCAALFLSGCAGKPAPAKPPEPRTLNLYSWADNFEPSVITDFEKTFNCKVNYDVFASNEELLAKIQAGGGQYDVIQPSDYMVASMIKLNLLEKFNKRNMPNLKNIDPEFARTPYDPSGEYSSIYSWGITGIAYNKKFVKEPPSGWADFWLDKYKGRVVLFDDSREVIGMALKKNGYSNSTQDPAQLEKAFQDLKKLAPNVLAYDSETVKQKFIAEEAWIGMMWSSYAALTQEENPNIEFIAAKEHGLIWADTLAIPKNAKNKDLAEKFINYLYEPKVSAKNFEALGYIDPNVKASELHSADYKNNNIFKTTKNALKDSEWLTDAGTALTLYDKYWTELKSGK